MGLPHPRGLLCYWSEAALTPRRQNSSWASPGPCGCHRESLSGCLGPLPPPGQDGRLMDRPPHSAPALPQCSARATLPGGLLDKHGLKAPRGHTGPAVGNCQPVLLAPGPLPHRLEMSQSSPTGPPGPQAFIPQSKAPQRVATPAPRGGTQPPGPPVCRAACSLETTGRGRWATGPCV